MIEAVLSIRSPQTWIQRIAAKYHAKIRILDCKALEGGEGVEELFEAIADRAQADRLLKDLREDSYISELEIISAKNGRITGSVKTHKCTACRSFALSNCFLVSVVSNEDGHIEWTLLGGEESYRNLLKSLERQGIEAKVKRLSRAGGEKSLTARQEGIIQIAFEKGYFDYPKGISLRGLASMLNISPPTLSELLRKAQKKILQEHFRGRVSTVSRQSRL